MPMDRDLDNRIRKRARQVCEYCHMPQGAYRFTFPIDHIIARQHGGKTSFENLALACLRCNAHKGPNISGIDPDSGEIVRLFNPRKDAWNRHFEWNGAVLVGLSAIARATIFVLDINHPSYVAIRAGLISEGELPT
jgi:HNH endonuclease